MPQAKDEAGNIWEVDAQGNPVRLVQPAGAGRIIPKEVSPTEALEVPKVQGQIAGQGLDNTGQAIDNTVSQGTARTTIQTNQAPAGYIWVDPNDPNKGVRRIPGYKPDGAASNESDKAVAARRILEMLDGEGGIGEQFRDNFANEGVGSFNEYNPFRAANQAFDVKANAMLPFAKKLLRTPGEGAQSDKEAQDYRDQLPRSTFRDGTNEQLIKDLRDTALSVLENEGVDVATYDPAAGGFTKPNALTYQRTDGGATQGLQAATGTTRAVPYPEEGQTRHDALVASLVAANGGRLPVDAYLRGRAELDAEFGVQSDPEANAAWVGQINEYLENGGATIPTGIEAGQEEMSRIDQARNSLVNNAGGAAVAGGLNALTVGAPEALAGGGQMDALRDEYPMATLGGEIAGAIGGTGAIGFAGRQGLKALGRQGVQSQFGRNLATDATYGAAYGGITEGDPLTGAALGAVGSAVGQGVGKIAGDAIGGVKLSQAAQNLRDRGVSLTGGRIMGDTASKLEDKLVSVPFVGDMIRRRQGDAFEEFNQAAFREGGAPIGFNPTATGGEGIGQFKQAVGGAYDNATAGVNVPLDDQFYADLERVRGLGGNLPDDLATRYQQAIQNRVDPLVGDTYYHGTKADFDGPLKPGKSGVAGPGIYLTPNKEVAEGYARGYPGSKPGRVIEQRVGGKLAPFKEYQDTLEAFPASEGADYSRMATESLKERGFTGVDARDQGDFITVFDTDLLNSMTGDQYQQAFRGLKGYKAEATKPGFEQDYRDAISQAQDALTSQMQRGGGASVIEGLGKADSAYKNFKILENASLDKAKVGTQTDEVGVFTPAQLIAASRQSERKYGASPLKQLGEDGQRVLPSTIPNSGTTDRALAAGLGAVGLGGAGEYAATGDAGTTANIAAAIALLSAGGTRKGQKALETIMLDRPDAAKKLGENLRKRKGLFGSAAVPIALTAQ